MRIYCFRVAVAFLTFFIGLGSQRLTHFRDQNHSLVPNVGSGPIAAATNISQERLWPNAGSLILEGDDTKPLAYHGCVIKRFFKSRIINVDGEDGRTNHHRVMVSFARLFHRGKVVATFDANFVNPLGNDTTYGLVSLLGPGTQQLAVYQSSWRAGEYSVVNFDGTARIIFCTGDWTGLGDLLTEVDLDGDGTNELLLNSAAFYDFQDKLYIGRLPRPELVFKYDKQARKYLPANLYYSDYLLRNLEVSIKGVEPPKDSLNFEHIGEVLDITLRLMYAGKSNEAWAFYDSTYKVSDKEDLRKRVQADLDADPYYQWLLNYQWLLKNAPSSSFRRF